MPNITPQISKLFLLRVKLDILGFVSHVALLQLNIPATSYTVKAAV